MPILAKNLLETISTITPKMRQQHKSPLAQNTSQQPLQSDIFLSLFLSKTERNSPPLDPISMASHYVERYLALKIWPVVLLNSTYESVSGFSISLPSYPPYRDRVHEIEFTADHISSSAPTILACRHRVVWDHLPPPVQVRFGDLGLMRRECMRRRSWL